MVGGTQLIASLLVKYSTKASGVHEIKTHAHYFLTPEFTISE